MQHRQHHQPQPQPHPLPLRPGTAWAIGLAAAMALLWLLAAVGAQDEQIADQATAEHSAWLQGLAVGELRANEALLEGLAECHRARPSQPMGPAARPSPRQPAGGGLL